LSTINKYNQAFIETFSITDDQLADLKYQDVAEWDSVGHMVLVSALEEALGVELDIDDIIDFSSYKKGKEILKKYNVEIL
jgi:acyl carrier protein